MQLWPETRSAPVSIINIAIPNTYQLIEAVSYPTRPVGLHLFKFGVDLLLSQYLRREQRSRPVIIERTDGTGALLLDFRGTAARHREARTTCAVRTGSVSSPIPAGRWSFGGGSNRDGITDRVNLTPRVGSRFAERLGQRRPARRYGCSSAHARWRGRSTSSKARVTSR